MVRSRLLTVAITTLLCIGTATARDTVYVDLSGIDNIVTNPPLTDQQKADLKSWILADIQANFDVAGVDIQVTDDPSVPADRTVRLQPSIGSYTRSNGSTGYMYGDWAHGSRECNVYLGNFFNRHGSDYKTNGQWDMQKLRKGIGRTAAHEVAHSYSVGHNRNSDPPNKMTEGGLVGSSTRANTEWVFDSHSAEVMRNNLGHPPCQTTADYDADYLRPYLWDPPLFPNPEYDPNDPNSDPFNDLDEYGCFDALLLIDGPLATHFDLGWYGVDTDGGLQDGNPDFDFIYKASLAEAQPPELLTFFELAHATAQFVLRGRAGSGYDGQWFPMDQATVNLADPAFTPAGDEVFRQVVISWDVDTDGIPDVDVVLDSYMLYPYGAEFNGWRLEHAWPCRGDLNFDNNIDLADLAIMLAHYNQASGALYEYGDLDGDRDVDLADLAIMLAAYGTSCPGTYCVGPGDDCWRTDCNGNTFADFSENPIPADFFGPGSEPFVGTIELGGLTGLADTVIHRYDQMCFDPPLPATAEVPIELVQLDLVSCTPVMITIAGQPTWWDVHMTIGQAQPPGVLSATMTDDAGGFFTAEYYIQPVYEFTHIDPPYETVVYDTGALGVPPVLMSTVAEMPWSTDESFDACTLDGFAPGVIVGIGGTPCALETCFQSVGTNSNQRCSRTADYPDCPQ